MELIIGIPSYKRPKKLIKLINNLEKIIPDNTEILVVENFSEKTLKKQNIDHKNIKYICKAYNQGLDKSLLQMICYAKRFKKKIWFICDDDELYIENIPLIINKIKENKSLVHYINWLDIKGLNPVKNNHDAYLRMSFLPCVAINPQNLKLINFYKLKANGYIHIAIINSLIKNVNEINLIQIDAGKQSRNFKTGFLIVDTFINGYRESLKYEQVLDNKSLNKLLFERVYSALNYLKKEKFNLKILKKFFIFCIKQKDIKLIMKIKFLIKALLIKWIWLLEIMDF